MPRLGVGFACAASQEAMKSSEAGVALEEQTGDCLPFGDQIAFSDLEIGTGALGASAVKLQLHFVACLPPGWGWPFGLQLEQKVEGPI